MRAEARSRLFGESAFSLVVSHWSTRPPKSHVWNGTPLMTPTVPGSDDGRSGASPSAWAVRCFDDGRPSVCRAGAEDGATTCRPRTTLREGALALEPLDGAVGVHGALVPADRRPVALPALDARDELTLPREPPGVAGCAPAPDSESSISARWASRRTLAAVVAGAIDRGAACAATRSGFSTSFGSTSCGEEDAVGTVSTGRTHPLRT